jgi:hypothetical protein
VEKQFSKAQILLSGAIHPEKLTEVMVDFLISATKKDVNSQFQMKQKDCGINVKNIS